MNHILIAEDEARLASILEKGLNKNGFVTAIASDGQTALNMAVSGNFELVLLDLGLPVKDGFTVLEELRTQDPQIPVLIVTAQTDDSVRRNLLLQGADDYINKPFSFKDLLTKVKFHLDRLVQDFV